MRIAIIPARGGSKRIPDKNIVDFLGAPLLSYSIRAAEKSNLFDVIHVSTDSEQIANVAARLGHRVEFMRDPALADDHTPLLPVLKWTLEQYGARGRSFTSVCLLMPTAPLIDADDLQRAEQVFRENGGDRTLIAVSRYNAPVEWAFHLEDNNRLVACYPGMAHVRSQDLKPTYYDSGTFVFSPAGEILAGKVDDERMIGFPIARHKAIDIDDAEDFEFAEIIFRGLKNISPEIQEN